MKSFLVIIGAGALWVFSVHMLFTTTVAEINRSRVQNVEPSFAVGDCAAYVKENPEEWENKKNPTLMVKILQVGKGAYLVDYLEVPNNPRTEYFSFVNRFTKFDCAYLKSLIEAQ